MVKLVANLKLADVVVFGREKMTTSKTTEVMLPRVKTNEEEM